MIGKFLVLGPYYINTEHILYFRTYNRTTQTKKDHNIPDGFDFAVQVEWNGNDDRSTTYYLTNDEWQYTCSQIKKLGIGAI